METCPVCKNEALLKNPIESDKRAVDCRRCGKYKISGSLIKILNQDATIHSKLAAYLRENFEMQKEEKYIDSYSYKSIEANAKNFRLSERIKKFLNYLALKTTKFGENIQIDLYRDWTLAYCQDEDEFIHFLNELKTQEVISAPPFAGTVTNDNFGKTQKVRMKLTYKAWIELFEKAGGGHSRSVFLAYDFSDQEIEKVVRAMRSCLVEMDFDPIDLKSSSPGLNQTITDKIISEIRQAKFIIVESSIKNANVYYEAGFAMGLDTPVIFVCQKDKISELPFDTNHYPHIDWELEKIDEFQEKLKNRIKAYKL